MPFFDPEAVARVLQPRTAVEVEALGGEFAPVHRVVLDDGSTVVVKERRHGGAGWGYDAANLRNERAALEILGEVAGGAAVAPRFVAGDVDAGVVVMTDLGTGRVLEPLLLDPNAGAEATAGLVELGRALGRFHAATASAVVHERFVSRRTALGGPYDAATERTRYVIHDLAALWADVPGHAAALGFTPPSSVVDEEVAQLWRALADPGPFLALTHLDASPQNCVLGDDGGARLVDFEGAGLRHLGLDAAFLRFPFPNYGHWSVLPEPVRAAMETTYRQTLVDGGIAAAADDAAYDQAMAVGCATTVILRIHRLPRIADDDEQSLRRRTQMVSAIEVFRVAAATSGAFPKLASWFGGLADEMRSRWTDANERPREFPALPLHERVST